ncbi:hypothetical protein D6851_02490 [Altericroceibacterium spongiae]|uniref:Uncharacterized protein n=1 Tax=Altericroceibacterium spongiae TaxID=2320269 RepID=A0A420ERQ5_9SPHN|nr:hypothetical protein [Altericroceibacterium spongiae]RKF23359.1 hypothetical protein D6851_02490 [Altericroceibacterium spongiae]
MNEKAERPDATIDQPSVAADGGHVPGACNTLGEFVRSLEDGQFDADCYDAIKDLAATMQEHAWRSGGKSKGKITITLDFVQEGGVTEIKAKFKAAKPEASRAKSIMWATEDHRMTRTRPGQKQLFGIRDVSGSAPMRDA